MFRWTATASFETAESAGISEGKHMFDIVQLGLIMAVAAAILGSALAVAWRDANRDPRLPREHHK